MKIELFPIVIFSLFMMPYQSAKAQEVMITLESHLEKKDILDKEKKQTRYTLYDQSMEEIFNIKSTHSFSQDDVRYKSANGEHLIYEVKKGKNKGYWTLNGQNLGTEKTLNEDIKTTSIFYKGITNKAYKDIKPLFFMNNTSYVALGRKKGKENYMGWGEMQTYIMVKNLENANVVYYPIKAPEGNYFKQKSHKLAYAGDAFFVLIFKNGREGSEHNYKAAYYDYTGTLLKSFNMKISKPEGSKTFGYFTLNSTSFNQVLRLEQVWQRQATNYNPILYVTLDSRATWKYDPKEDAFYLYASVINKKSDDGVIINKYDHTGKKQWEQYKTIPGSKFKMKNSVNRFISLKATSKFTGLRLYSVKGRHLNQFYLFNTATGEIIKEQSVPKKEYENAQHFNSYSGMMGVYSETYNSYMTNFKKNKEQNHFSYGFFTKKGFTLGISSKKDDKMKLLHFDF